MKQITCVLLLSLSLVQFATAGCWSVKDKADLAMSELAGGLTFSIRDAVTCEPVKDAVMQIGESTIYADPRGEITVEAPDGIMDAYIPYTLKSKGYITINDKFYIEAGVVRHTRFLMSKSISADAVRFVLSWADEPTDLDLHLVGKDFHVSYRNMHNYKNLVKLDSDAEDGYGAETITVGKKNSEDIYRLYVHKFSDEHSVYLDQQAKVSVYIDGRLDRVVYLPDTIKQQVEILQLRHGVIQYTNKAVDKI